MVRIGICGTQSVGKTTLVKYLQEKGLFKDYHFTTERSKELMKEGIPLNMKSTFKGQLVFFAERAKELIHDNLITDRTVIDVMSFSSTSEYINALDKMLLEDIYNTLLNEYDIIFYIPPLIDMEDNGVRETDNDFRILIDNKIQELFNRYRGRKHIINSLTVEARAREILKEVSNLNTPEMIFDEFVSEVVGR